MNITNKLIECLGNNLVIRKLMNKYTRDQLAKLTDKLIEWSKDDGVKKNVARVIEGLVSHVLA